MTTNGVRYNSGRAYFQTESVARRFNESVRARGMQAGVGIPYQCPGGWVVWYWMIAP